MFEISGMRNPDFQQNLVLHDASVLKAFSPTHAVNFFLRNKTEGWKSLGGILLAFTGTYGPEAIGRLKVGLLTVL